MNSESRTLRKGAAFFVADVEKEAAFKNAEGVRKP
jgi:hypothetical protein